MARDPEPARRALIRAGERLFAERGIDAVSLREINKAAGQRNASALHYHFGSRDGLLHAILVRHAETIRQRRLELLDELAGRDVVDAWSATRVLVEPLTLPLTEGRSGRSFARILPQVLTDPGRQTADLADFVGDTAREEAYDLLAPHCATLPEPLVRARLGILQLQVVHAVADRARLQDHRRADRPLAPLEFFVPNLIDMFVSSLLGPASPPAIQALEGPDRPVRGRRSLTADGNRPQENI
jgi:AcrR family transcriptional regulator